MKEKIYQANEENGQSAFDKAFDELIWKKSPEYRALVEKQKELEEQIRANKERRAQREAEYQKKIADLEQEVRERVRRK
jgi:glutaredoxin